MFFSFYTPKDFSFFTTIGILSHKAARRSTDQSSRSSSDISALPTIDDSRLPRSALRRRSGNRWLRNFRHSPVPSCNLTTGLFPDGSILSPKAYIHLNGFYRYSYCRLTGKEGIIVRSSAYFNSSGMSSSVK